MIEIMISILVVLGALFMLFGSIGLLRLPDVYGRISALTKSATFGVIGIMIAMFTYFLIEHSVFNWKILLTIVFVFVTAPVVEFVVSRAAYFTGIPLSDKTVMDELQEDLKKQGIASKVSSGKGE